MGCYSRLMVQHPFVLIVVDVVLGFVLGPLTIWIYGIPDFSDPTKGFTPRGSKINNWENIASNLGNFYTPNNDLTAFSSYPRTNYSLPRTNYSLPVSETGSGHHNDTRVKRYSLDNLRTCTATALVDLNRWTPRLVVESRSGADNIFTIEHLHSICRLQERLSNYPWSKKSCYMISIPLYISAIVNKPNCLDINEADLKLVMDALMVCVHYYNNTILQPFCDIRNTCPLVPMECLYFQAAYSMLHILSDNGFMANGNPKLQKVAFSMILIPNSWYKDTNELVEFYMKTFDNKKVYEGDIEISAMNLGIELQIFTTYVLGDVPWYILAITLVIAILLVYLMSFVLMLAVVANVAITLCLSYFIYHYIFQLTFFPFMNVIAALILIAVCADDVFVIYDIWRQELRENPDYSYEEVMTQTLHKGGLSIFVTSLTTAAALMSNVMSEITTIRCFGIFSAICMLVNIGLMITWIPPLIVIIEKVFNYCVPHGSYSSIKGCCGKITETTNKFWQGPFTKLITKLAPLWILLLSGVAILGAIATFFKPGLRLPNSSDIKIFGPDHPFEKYFNVYSRRIRIEQEMRRNIIVQLQMVWGVEGVDNGNPFDPDDYGTLEFYPLDVYSDRSVIWLDHFCETLKRQSFVLNTEKNKTCFFQAFHSILTGPCDVMGLDLGPCCGHSQVNESSRRVCIPYLTHLTKGNIGKITGQTIFGGVLFNYDDELKVFRYQFDSDRVWLPNYEYTNEMVKEINKFTEQEMASGPGKLKDGWYCTINAYQFRFYDLQLALSSGTLSGIGISLAAACLVMILTSLNIILALYAIVTISLVIISTIGTLVLLGWELNVTESVSFTLALGLAVDFTIHYGMAYKLSPHVTRFEKVKEVVGSMTSAVSMGALTTFVTGASVMPSRVLAYRQFGMFFLIIMTYSWIFSTFFFLPVCYLIGPTGNTGDITYLFRRCRRKRQSTDPVSDQSSEATQDRHNSTSNDAMAVFVKRPEVGRLRPLRAHGSVDSKLYDTEVRIHHQENNPMGYAACDPIVVRIPGAKNKQLKREASESTSRRSRSRQRREADGESDPGDTLSSGRSHSSKTYVYNVHVYCVGDVRDAEVLHKQAKKRRRNAGSHYPSSSDTEM